MLNSTDQDETAIGRIIVDSEAHLCECESRIAARTKVLDEEKNEDY